MAAPTVETANVASTSWHGATANSPLAVTTSAAHDVIVLGITAEPNNNTPIAVSTITNTGTAVLAWIKLIALQWATNSQQSCLEIWYALAPSAGTYNVTVTMNETADGAVLFGVPVAGTNLAVPIDTAVTATTTNAFPTQIHPQIAGLASNTNDVLVLAFDSGGYNVLTFGTHPTSGVAQTIVKQVTELAGTNFSVMGCYSGSVTAGLSAASVVTLDSMPNSANDEWGIIAIGLTADTGGGGGGSSKPGLLSLLL